MSKAFTKEDGGAGPERLPDLPVSPHPNHVTPRGLRQLQDRQARLEADVARLRQHRDALDDHHPLTVAERDLRYIEARLSSAILMPAPEEPVRQVRFGVTVTVVDEDGHELDYTIVGEDEAQPDQGLIAFVSPLARALMEARVGDAVEWVRPAGTVELEIIAIRCGQEAEPRTRRPPAPGGRQW